MTARRGASGADHEPPSLIPYGLMVVTIAIATLAVLAMLFLNDARRVPTDEATAEPPAATATVNDFPLTE